MPSSTKSAATPLRACVLLVLLCATSMSSSADGDTPLQQSLSPGMRVRIVAPEVAPRKMVGTVSQVTADSVAIDIPGRNEPVSISREKIDRLDVSYGQGLRGVHAAIGAIVGAAIGAVACAALNGSGQGHIVSTGDIAGICAIIAGGLGAGIGAAVPPGERWKAVPTRRYRVSFAPRLDHGADFAVAWKY
jgi:hypothetical protein